MRSVGAERCGNHAILMSFERDEGGLIAAQIPHSAPSCRLTL